MTGASGAGSRVAEVVGNALTLTSDRDRSGQEAFTASPFSRLALTHALSVAGDAFVTLALAGSLFFNISLTAARGKVALSLLLTMAPFGVVAPFLGPIIDRTKGGRRAMVLSSAVGRAVACLLMAATIHSLWLFPAAFLTLVCSKGYSVAKSALVPSAVSRSEDLVEANSKLAVGGAIIGFIAAIPGVAILKLLGGAWLLRIDVVLFAACAITAVRLYEVRPGPARGKQAGVRPASSETEYVGPPSATGADAPPVALAPELPAGAIQVAAAAMGTLRLIVGFMTFLVAFGFRHDHAPAWWYGLVLACSLGGNLIGAAIAPWLRSRLREEWILLASLIAVVVTGLVAIQLDMLHRHPAASMLAGVVGLSAGAAKLAFDSMVQRHVPSAAQGRAFGRFEAGFQLVWVVGGLVPVVISMSLRAGFAVVTIAALFAAVVYLVGAQLARLHRLPYWWPGARRPRPGAPPRSGRAPGPGAAGRRPGDPTDPAGDNDDDVDWPVNPSAAATTPVATRIDRRGTDPTLVLGTEPDDPGPPLPDFGSYPPRIAGPPPLGQPPRLEPPARPGSPPAWSQEGPD